MLFLHYSDNLQISEFNAFIIQSSRLPCSFEEEPCEIQENRQRSYLVFPFSTFQN